MEETTPMNKPFNTAAETTQHHHKWADLPKVILLRITRHLDLTTDLPRLRGVCPSWRSAIPLADFPLRETHFEAPRLEDFINIPLFLLKTRFYLIYPLHGSPSCGGWIVRMGELGLNKWRLLNPLHNNMKCQRYFFTDPPITGVINLLDCRVVELARPMSLVHKLDYNAQPISKKVVDGARTVLVLLEEHVGGGLMLWRFGDQQWVKIDGIISEGSEGINEDEIIERFSVDDDDDDDDDGEVRNMLFKRFKVDIAFHNGKFYVFQVTPSFECRVWVINPGDFSILKQVINNGLDILQQNERYCYDHLSVNFVPSNSNGCLYLFVVVLLLEDQVYRHKLIFKLKEEKGESKWEQVENMGDMTFFIGYNVSFALPPPPRNMELWKTSSIYSFCTSGTLWLTRHTVENCDPQMPEGVECLRKIFYPSYNKYFKLFSMDEDDKDAKMCSMERKDLCTRLFFPPPSWVKWRCPSLDNVEIRFDRLRYCDLY